jgi:nucleoside phosphorylase
MTQGQSKRPSRTSYHVAWICAVADLELLPAVLMLDEQNERPDDIDTEFDANTYKFGTMAGHNVVLATCRQGMTGNINMGNITGPLLMTFPSIRMTLLVGIGGGVPQPNTFSDPINDLRLGDVVVGWPTSASTMGAVVYHEFGRSKVDGFEILGSLDKPHNVLLNAVPFLKLEHDLGQTTFHEHMAKLQSNPRLGSRFKHPGLEHDLLFEPTYKHIGDYNSKCAGCDTDKLVRREPRNKSDKDIFIYHQGRIATGNSVIMDGEKRDSISERCGGALCVEMEAAGVEANGRVLVIRGISDYADSHKSDVWRSYAAAKAVAFARELLGRIPARDVKEKMAAGQSSLYNPEPEVYEVDWGSVGLLESRH